MNDRDTVELTSVPSELEARGIESLLESEGIDCFVIPQSSTSFPGVFDGGRPWGTISVEQTDHDRARELLKAWNEAAPFDPEDEQTPGSYRRELKVKRFSRLSLAALLLAIVLPPVGLVLGVIALREAKKEKKRPGNMALAIVSIAIASYFTLMGGLLLFVGIMGRMS